MTRKHLEPYLVPIVALALAGHDAHAVAAKLGYKLGTVKQALSQARAAGVVIPRRPGHNGGGWWREGVGPQSKYNQISIARDAQRRGP